jgi:hypothetical protein
VEPMIRFSNFNSATMLITYFETPVHGIVLWCLLYFLPLFYEACKEYTPIISGVAMLPESGFVARKSPLPFQNQIKQKLMSYSLLAPLAGEYSKDATALVSIIKNMAEGVEKTQLKQAYADSLKIIWVVMRALAGAALIAGCFTKGYSLEQEHTTQQG